MADFISIDASELESFGQQIAAAPDLIRDASQRMMDNIGRDVVTFGRHYPSPPSGLKQPFVSAKQRRWFFSALRSGAITVPYRRTGTLYANWKYSSIPGDTIFRIEVYNNTPYRRYVQGRAGEQARIHRGRWNTHDEIEKAAEEAMGRRLSEASDYLMEKFLVRLGK